MRSKENLALDYIFFRYPSYYIIMIFPVLAGLIGIFFVSETFTPTTRVGNQAVQTFEYNMLNTYLEACAVVLSFVISYFVIFKWVLMKTNGTYGFWITQGVNRVKYFSITITKMVLIVILSYLVGFAYVFLLAGISLDTHELTMLLLLLISNIIMTFAIAVLTSELITDPELGATIFLGYSGVNLFFNRNYDSILHKILLSDRHYARDDALVVFFLSLITALGILFAGLQLHLHRGVDL